MESTLGKKMWFKPCSIQLYQSSGSSCTDRYCEENKQILIFLLCTIVLEFPDEGPMGKYFLRSLNLCDIEIFGYDPASKLTSCSQGIKIQIFLENLWKFLFENFQYKILRFVLNPVHGVDPRQNIGLENKGKK